MLDLREMEIHVQVMNSSSRHSGCKPSGDMKDKGVGRFQNAWQVQSTHPLPPHSIGLPMLRSAANPCELLAGFVISRHHSSPILVASS